MYNGYSTNTTKNKITRRLVQLVDHELSLNKIHCYFLHLSIPLVAKCLKMTISNAKFRDLFIIERDFIFSERIKGAFSYFTSMASMMKIWAGIFNYFISKL